MRESRTLPIWQANQHTSNRQRRASKKVRSTCALIYVHTVQRQNMTVSGTRLRSGSAGTGTKRHNWGRPRLCRRRKERRTITQLRCCSTDSEPRQYKIAGDRGLHGAAVIGSKRHAEHAGEHPPEREFAARRERGSERELFLTRINANVHAYRHSGAHDDCCRGSSTL